VHIWTASAASRLPCETAETWCSNLELVSGSNAIVLRLVIRRLLSLRGLLATIWNHRKVIMGVSSNCEIHGRLRRAAFTISTILVAVVGLARTSASKPAAAAQRPKSGKVVLYAAVGAELTQFDVNVQSATLVKRGSVALPGNIQYAWPHPSKRYLYVAWSNESTGNQHGMSAFRIDPISGALRPHGQSVRLPARPIHVTTDIPGTHLLVSYPFPSGVTVHRLGQDGTIDSQVKQSASLDVGIYTHQMRVDPSNRMVILAARGSDPRGDKPEDPGSLKILSYKDGLLTNRASIAPGGGFGFGPRHVDFSGPFVFVSLERENKLLVYKKLADETLSSEPLFTKDSLTDPSNVRPGQAAGTVHVHPSGKFVYQANRATGTTNFEGKTVFIGGENAIAVYAINQHTGEPTLIQNIDTRGIRPRTFALDASGRVLVAANQDALLVRDEKGISTVPASLAVYRVRDDGTLDFVRKYDVETDGTRSLFWMGLVTLP
jgi:6-phosphogluconolactonase